MFRILSRSCCMFRGLKSNKYKIPINVFLCLHRKKNYSVLAFKSNFITVLRKHKIQHIFAFFCSNSRNDYSRFLKRISSSTEYEQVAEETLQSLSDKFEELLEDSDLLDWDVTYSNDVLTISLNNHDVYVINKQSPNKQIWLSSPFSGPKRYDFKDGIWVYKHEGISLHQLLNEEISKVLQKEVSFIKCSYADKKNSENM